MMNDGAEVIASKCIDDFGELPPIRQRLPVDERHANVVALLELDTDPLGQDAVVLYCVSPEHDQDRAASLAARYTKQMKGHGLNVQLPLFVSSELLALIRASEALGRVQSAHAQAVRAAATGQARNADQRVPGAAEPDGIFKLIMETALSMGASDIHFCVRESSGAVLFRIHGVLRRWRGFPKDLLTQSIAYAYNTLKMEGTQSHAMFSSDQMQSAMIALINVVGQDVNLRYQSAPCVGGYDVVVRTLRNAVDEKPRTLLGLGYTPWQVERLAEASTRTTGGILIAGVTGSGKTTTLNTLTAMNPMRRLKKTISIEDPVEYRQRMVTQISVQRKIDDKDDGKGKANPFTAAQRAVLRMDPDTLIFGEIRDSESGSIAQAAIETGHLVFATVHASSAVGIVPRLTSKLIALERDAISSDDFISALIYQRLVPTNCPHCQIPILDKASGATADTLHVLEQKFGLDLSQINVASDYGCSRCQIAGLPASDNSKLGVHGVTVTAEMVFPTLEFLALIRESRDNEAKLMWRKSRTHGFAEDNMQGKTAFEHALFECNRGRIDPYYIEDSFGSLNGYQVISIAND